MQNSHENKIPQISLANVTLTYFQVETPAMYVQQFRQISF